MKKSLLTGIVIVIALVAFLVLSGGNKVSGQELTMYKSPTCGCCVGNAGILRNSGFDVNIVPTSNMQQIKTMHNIPIEMQSCHTSIIGEYFVEGHIPQEAIDKLLEEQPDIDGIALPGMPSGSPGMPGHKTGEWIIYSLKDGKYSEFMRV